MSLFGASSENTKRKDLPKNPVLELIGKSFWFLGTQLSKNYQILVISFNKHQRNNSLRTLPEISNSFLVFVKNLLKDGNHHIFDKMIAFTEF